jgi:hypothetical protein
VGCVWRTSYCAIASPSTPCKGGRGGGVSLGSTVVTTSEPRIHRSHSPGTMLHQPIFVAQHVMDGQERAGPSFTFVREGSHTEHSLLSLFDPSSWPCCHAAVHTVEQGPRALPTVGWTSHASYGGSSSWYGFTSKSSDQKLTFACAGGKPPPPLPSV